MNYITTTDLRTKSSELIKALEDGQSIDLIHRSRLVGRITPAKENPKIFDAKRFAKLVKTLNLPPTTYAERERIYRKHLMKKYGKDIFGR